MNTRFPLTGSSLLVLGGLVCTMLGDSTPAQVTQIKVASRSTLRAKGLESGCVNAFRREPVLAYDKSGSTFAGPVHVQLTVYSDGLATYSRIDPFDGDGAVSVRSLSAREVAALADSLLAVGAQVLCDDPTLITDVPLATVTVFEVDGADAAAHTFSYYDAASGAPALVESILRDFISAKIEGS